MNTWVDAVVIVCLFIALYINLTDFPRPAQERAVTGPLIKLGLEQ